MNSSSCFMRIRLLRVGGMLMRDMALLVVLLDLVMREAGKLLFGEHGDQAPADIEGLIDGAVLGGGLVDKLMLEGLAELKVLLVDGTELFLTDDRGQRADFLHMRIGSIELSRNVRVIGAGVAFANAV